MSSAKVLKEVTLPPPRAELSTGVFGSEEHPSDEFRTGQYRQGSPYETLLKGGTLPLAGSYSFRAGEVKSDQVDSDRPAPSSGNPAAAQHPAEQRAAGQRSSGPGLVQARGRCRVLVVDDEPGFVRALRRLLTAKGYVVEVAPSGGVAANLIASAPEIYDVVVTDIAMPELDGIELLRRVQARDSGVPVVLITGAPAVRTAIEAVGLGAFDYLTKPVSLSTLEATIQQAAEARRRQQQTLALLKSIPAPGNASLVELDGQFDRALDTLWLAFQPIVHAGSGHPFGFEVLLRSGDETLSDPGAILEAAETLGRVADVGRWVRAQAAATLTSAAEGTCLFVNVHPEDLGDPALVDPQSPLTQVARNVVLEITERASIDEVANLSERVARLRELGYRIALDDMGAGYANLNAFAQLEPEVIKLDMSLVRGLPQSNTKQKLVRSIVSLCRDMDTLIVGEGVESEEERDALIALGCDLLQGYLFSPPRRTLPRVD